MGSGRERILRLIDEERRPGDFPYTPVVLGDDIIRDARRTVSAQQVRLNLLPSLAGQSVLDLGSNTGYITIQLKKRGAALCVGVDVDPFMVKLARCVAREEQLQDIHFYEGDLFALDLTEPVDNVLCLSVLDYQEVLDVLDVLIGYGKRVFVEPTNHGWHHKTKQQIATEFVGALSRFGRAALLGFTDYQDRGLIQIDAF